MPADAGQRSKIHGGAGTSRRDELARANLCLDLGLVSGAVTCVGFDVQHSLAGTFTSSQSAVVSDGSRRSRAERRWNVPAEAPACEQALVGAVAEQPDPRPVFDGGDEHAVMGRD